MKSVLLLALASTALIAVASPAMAKEAKGDPNIFDDVQFIKPESAPMTTPVASAPEPELPPPAVIEPPKSCSKFEGVYLGADIGYSYGEMEVSALGVSNDGNLNGINGGAFIGFTVKMLGGYLGVEVGHEWSGADGNVGAVTFDRNTAWNFSVRPGIELTDNVLGYAILGYSSAEYEALGVDERFGGALFGAGFEMDTGTPLRARLEYTYTNYSGENIGGIDFDPNNNNIKLGLLYRF